MADFLKGIDVSRWQDPAAINWTKLKAGGYIFAFVKASDGSAYKRAFIDACIAHAKAAEAAGFSLGYYHFAHPTSLGGLATDAAEEAAFFLDTIQDFPAPKLPLVLDLEDEKTGLSPNEILQWVNLFKAKLDAAGQAMILYSSKTYLDAHLPTGHSLGEIPLWLAYYPRVFNPSQNPRIPNGWSKWSIWQYTQTGTVAGVAGAVDLNLMQGDFLQPVSRGIVAKVHVKTAPDRPSYAEASPGKGRKGSTSSASKLRQPKKAKKQARKPK